MPSSFLSVKGLFFVVSCVVLPLSCSKQEHPSVPPATAVTPTATIQRASPTVASPSDPAVEDQVLLSVGKALRRAKLLTRPDQCYAYRFDPGAGQPAYTVDIRENHSHPECGGDPQTQPHLFTVRVDKTTRVLTHDAKSPGAFQPVPP